MLCKEERKKKLANVVVVWCIILIGMATLVIGQEGLADGLETVLSTDAPTSEVDPAAAEILAGQALQSVSFKQDMTIGEQSD